MLRAMPGDLAERLIAASELHGDFVLSSGRRSSVYFDKFRFLTDPDLLRDTARALLTRECPISLVRAHIDDPAVSSATAGRMWAIIASGGCSGPCPGVSSGSSNRLPLFVICPLPI